MRLPTAYWSEPPRAGTYVQNGRWGAAADHFGQDGGERVVRFEAQHPVEGYRGERSVAAAPRSQSEERARRGHEVVIGAAYDRRPEIAVPVRGGAGCDDEVPHRLGRR